MTFVSRRLLLGMLLIHPGIFFSLRASARTNQTAQVKWQDENFFTQADRKALPALANIMGIGNPKRVFHGEFIPSTCPYVMIESVFSESGHLRTYQQLMAYRNDWKKCGKPVRGESKRKGRWFANSADLKTQREWKVQEDTWVKYVSFDDGVSYDDAETIILAVKHRQLVNRSPENAIPVIDPMDITSIQVKGGPDRTFKVWTSVGGAGEVFVVRIDDRAVELLEVSIWMA